MPVAKKTPAAKPAKATRKTRGTSALDGLEVSLDDAQKALAELRRDLSTGGRRLVKDVETAIKSARRDLARTRKAIQSDLGDLGGALKPQRTNRKPAKSAAKPAAKSAAKPAAKPAARTARRARAS
jgi:paraquat-inducible protein B